MLQAFTWQSFLIAALIFSLVWLLVVSLLFYRKEVFKFLSGKAPDVEPLPHAWQEDFEEEDPDDLMGKPTEPEGISVLGQHDFGFAPRIEAEETAIPTEADVNELLQTELFDLMEDVKPLLDEEVWDKTELIEAVNEQVRRYPRLAGSSLLETFYLTVAEQVRESDHLGFVVTVAELQDAL
ncbi:MAG: hypothetical protein ABIN91_02690 [Mucilaginibacter sp.]|uniref:hypothetical protein n=1 Tax=Mucilaginibacter sp. TaxID=1882438 RepID=UPI003266F362